MTADDLTLFTRQIAVMHQAGLSLPRAIEFYGRSGKTEMCQVALEVSERMCGGSTLTQALAARSDVFTMVYVGLVACGEKSGELRPVLGKLADLLERQQAMRQRLVSMLTYPAVLLSVSLLATAAFSLFVLPMLTPIFTSMNIELPLLTRMLIGFSTVVRHPITLLAVIGGLTLGIWQFQNLRSHVGRHAALVRRWDSLLLTIPAVGRTVRKIIAARVLYTMAAQLEAGIYTGEVLDHTAQVAGNVVIADAIRTAIVDLKTGMPLSDALAQNDVVPSGAIQMIRAGEESSCVAELIERAAQVYEDEVDISLMNLVLVLEPVVLLGLGVLVGLVVLAAMLPTVQLLKNL